MTLYKNKPAPYNKKTLDQKLPHKVEVGSLTIQELPLLAACSYNEDGDQPNGLSLATQS